MSTVRRGVGCLLCVLVVLLLGHTEGLGAQSERFVPDVRSHGMGRAYTALAEGVAVHWWNPAALGLSEVIGFQPQTSATLLPDLTEGVDVTVIGGSGSYHGIGLGVHRTRFTYPTQIAVDFSGNVIGEFQPAERTVLVGGGVEVLQFFGVDTDRYRLGTGVNWKDVDVELAPANVTRDGEANQGSTSDLDIGTIFSFRPGHRDGTANDSATAAGAEDPRLELRAGLVIVNVRDSEITFRDDGQPDPLGRQLRVGGAIEARWWDRQPFEHALKATFAFDHTSFHGSSGHRSGDRDGIWNLGGELSLLGLFAWRLGYISDSAGGLEDWTWGLGAGADLRLGGGARFGLRYDLARVPQPSPADKDVTYQTFALWFAP